ncbi:unnamed protein product [Coccothraustes coccothraustes]
MWWGWRTGAEEPPPARAWGAQPPLPALGSALCQRFQRGHNHPVAMVPAPQQGHGRHLLRHWDLPGPAENVQTNNHSAWPHRKTEFPSLPPFHPSMTRPRTTKAFLHGISDNSQSCEMSEEYGKAGNGGAWEGAPMVGQARLTQPEREGGEQKCQP